MNALALSAPATTPSSVVPSWVDRGLYPFEPRSWSSSDGRMSYLDEGRGKPLVVIHGTPSWSFEWRHLVLEGRKTRRVIAPDHLGFGLSEKPSAAPYAPRDHAERLLSLFDALDLHDVTLVLHDFGVPIGLPVALKRPDRVERLVLLNGWAWPFSASEAPARMSRFVASPLGRLLYRGFNASPRWIVPMSFGDGKRLTPSVHAQYLAPFPTWASRVAPWTLGCELSRSAAYYAELWARIGELRRLPTVFVWGEADPAFTPAFLARWTAALPDASLVLLPGVGHFPQEEAPEAVMRAALG